MANREQEPRQGFLWSDYAHGLRSGIRNTSMAYGYSILATLGFATLGPVAGSPTIRQMFLYGIGASLGFAVVEVTASRGFRAALVGTVVYLLVVGFELAFARRAERVREHS